MEKLFLETKGSNRKIYVKNRNFLSVRVIPKSKTESVEFISDTDVKVKISSPPEKGRANKRVIELLSDKFSIPKSKIKIVKGHSHRLKRISITP